MKDFLYTIQTAVGLFFVGLFLVASHAVAVSDCSAPLITDGESLVSQALLCNAGQQAIAARWQARKYQTLAAGQFDDPKL
ncbi:hypothetical protein JYU12_02590, partial [bacterium AH-315-K03]|nr:hypothetical protein [bacterium AH-315-K03]